MVWGPGLLESLDISYERVQTTNVPLKIRGLLQIHSICRDFSHGWEGEFLPRSKPKTHPRICWDLLTTSGWNVAVVRTAIFADPAAVPCRAACRVAIVQRFPCSQQRFSCEWPHCTEIRVDARPISLPEKVMHGLASIFNYIIDVSQPVEGEPTHAIPGFLVVSLVPTEGSEERSDWCVPWPMDQHFVAVTYRSFRKVVLLG